MPSASSWSTAIIATIGVLFLVWRTVRGVRARYRKLGRYRRIRQRKCASCGYDLRASLLRCPECAEAPDPQERADARLYSELTRIDYLLSGNFPHPSDSSFNARYSKHCHKVVELAKDLVRIRNDRVLGPRHLLAAIAADGKGVAAKLLRAKGFELTDLVAQLAPELAHDYVMVSRTPVKWGSGIFQSAAAESDFLGDDAIRTEHILLALLASRDLTITSLCGSKISHAETINQILAWRTLQSGDDIARRLNEQAWVLATTRDCDGRDPARALELAKRACELTGFAVASCLDTLGACYAACNQFEEAIRYVELAMQRCEGAEHAGCQKRVDLFRSGEAYVE